MSDYNAGEKDEVSLRQKKLAAALREEDEALGEFLKTVAGRRWFKKILEDCHIFQNPFSDDALKTAFSCGEMNVGQKLLVNFMRVAPNLYIQMMKEVD